MIFNPENAAHFGQFLGRRYRERPIIWVMGGDRKIRCDEEANTIRAMAAGLERGDGGRHLMSFHPLGQHHSSMWFHDDEWLDFNMCQSGHTRDRDNYNSVAADYARMPIKPCIDAEPGYEDLPNSFNPELDLLKAHDCRKFLYWALFAGAFGHTYGCNEIWQMWQPGRKPRHGAAIPWFEALALPGAAQMQHGRRLIEEGPYFDRLPDQSLIASPNPNGGDHVCACRGPQGQYALVYIPTGHPVKIRTHLLQADTLDVQWLDPRTGEWQNDGQISGSSSPTLTTPGGHADWVLRLTRA